MSDLDEFGTELKKENHCDAELVQEAPMVEGREDKEATFTSSFCQWAKYPNGMFQATSVTTPVLTPGCYQIDSNRNGIIFTAHQLRTDDLIRLKDEYSVSLLKEINDFWSLEKEFKEFGFLHKRGIIMHGPAGCLTADTHINYGVKDKNGKIQNKKGGTIERLYQRFNNIKPKGKGYNIRKETIDSSFFVTSINENDIIVRNNIEGVVYSGEKECFHMTCEKGYSVDSTEDHKYYIGNGKYLPLKDLKIGGNVYIHDNTLMPTKRQARKGYSETTVKYHPNAPKKKVSGHLYHRCKVHILAYEASKNNLSYDDYKKMLNSEIKKPFWVVPKGSEVHHKDKDRKNNNINNLELLTKKEHLKLHGYEQAKQIQYHATSVKILDIKRIGIQKTYDIQCQAPYNNFIANDIVVHNSGKTCIIQQIITDLITNFDGIVILCTCHPSLVADAIKQIKQIEPRRKLICLFEDIDAIIKRFGESDMLSLLDGETQINNVLNLATTNYPEVLDKRIVSRPRRFDRRIKIDMPDASVRLQYFTNKVGSKVSEEEIKKWVDATEGFSFAALTELVVLTKCLKNDFEKAIKDIRDLTECKINSNQYEKSEIGFKP